ncbi:hypothetical protein O2V63_07500 [Modestobacter sp. VKM Ac-2977]|uniref:hypothetical protein n=1 Tax=Modestobacter sp. VKM Ac-2977 TaxID=3004131 RepID=UPI0022AB0737|nr:hypothetical protein [Modestobacter sp. VKM Ac-2977]MCZ2820168.1 hypothetical protein [Modestobacter sp. VKM Ac-2977]
MDDVELQERLARLAERTAPRPREQLAQVVVARHRTQRRQNIGTAAVAAAVTGLVVLTSTVLDGPSAEPATAIGADAAGRESAAAAVDVLAGPARGSLAGDAAFVDGARRLSWTEADDPNRPTAATEPPLDSRQVVFAGDVTGGRWALVLGQDTIQPEPPVGSGLAAAWFTGPPGATADQLQPAGLSGGVDTTMSLALSDASTGALVVVAAPGDEIQVSERPLVAADGTVSREFEPVDAPDGVAVLALPPASGTYAEALRFRVVRDGAEVVTAMPTTHRSDWSRTTPEVPIEWLRGTTGATGADAVLDRGVDDALTSTGLSPDDVAFSVVWAGDVPAPSGQTARVQLLGATLPSGAVYLTALLGRDLPDGSVVSTWCGTDLRPAAPPLAEQLFAVECSTPFLEGTEPVDSLVLVGPSAATTALLVDGTGSQATAQPLVGGVAVLQPFEDLTAVEFLAPDGTSLGRTEPMGHADMESLDATPSGGN